MLPNRKHLYPTSLRWALDLRPSYYCFTGPDRKRLQSVLHCLDDHHAGGESIAIVTTTSQSSRTAATAAAIGAPIRALRRLPHCSFRNKTGATVTLAGQQL
jgi:hypothetical protein